MFCYGAAYRVYYCNRTDVIVYGTIYKKVVSFPIETRIRGIVFQINKYRYAVKAQLGNAVSSADLFCNLLGYVKR